MKAKQDSVAHKNSPQNNENTVAPLTLRDRYWLEIEQIKKEVGDLEDMRTLLGLSQRKLCQLLMVDPSAWTRWSRTGAPPHIYQALRWLIELKKVNPEAVAPIDISSRLDFVQASTQNKIKDLENQVASLERALTVQNSVSYASPSPDLAQEQRLKLAFEQQAARFQKDLAELKLVIEALQHKAQPNTKARKTKLKTKKSLSAPVQRGKKIEQKKRPKKVVKKRVQAVSLKKVAKIKPQKSRAIKKIRPRRPKAKLNRHRK